MYSNAGVVSIHRIFLERGQTILEKGKLWNWWLGD